MARRVSPTSDEAKFYLEKYENSRKAGKDQEMTQFLEQVSAQDGTHIVDNPNVNESPGHLELGYSQKRQGRFNDNSLSKMKNIFNGATAATGKGKAHVKQKEPTESKDAEELDRKSSSKMNKMKKLFGKDKKDKTHLVASGAEKVMAMLKTPDTLPFHLAQFPELPKTMRHMSNGDLPRDNSIPRFTVYYGNSDDSDDDDGPYGFGKKKSMERGRSGFQEKTATAHAAAKNTSGKGVATSDVSARPVRRETKQDQRPSVPSHRDPVYPYEQVKHMDRGQDFKKPLYDDQGFLCEDSKEEDCHFTGPPAVSRYRPASRPQFGGHGVNSFDHDDEVGESSSQGAAKHAYGDESGLNSLAVAHYAPSIQRLIAKPEQAVREYKMGCKLVKAEQEAKARRRAEAEAKEKAYFKSKPDSSLNGAIPSVPSLQELKRQEAEQGKGPAQFHKDKQAEVKNWLDAPRLDPGRRSPDSLRQYSGKKERKIRRTSSLASYKSDDSTSREARGVRMIFGLPTLSNQSDGSKKVKVMTTIKEDELEADAQPELTPLHHPTPTRVVRLSQSVYDELSPRRKESEASDSPQRDTADPPSSPFDIEPRDRAQTPPQPVKGRPLPSIPKDQILEQQRSAVEEIELIKRRIEAYDNGEGEYHDYEAPGDSEAGFDPDDFRKMYPRPLLVIKESRMRSGGARSPIPASKGPRGPQVLQGPRPLSIVNRHPQHPRAEPLEPVSPLELGQPLHPNGIGAGVQNERIHADSNEMSPAHMGRIIEGMADVMEDTLERMEKLEAKVGVLTNKVRRMRLLLADSVGVDTEWYKAKDGGESDEEEPDEEEEVADEDEYFNQDEQYEDEYEEEVYEEEYHQNKKYKEE
ncbi:hypothetical protein F4805DRAFT_461491 [Annulohypoxylon moriforme]|nr:hypothetical protein F4805DRAFT_461491 [Annulohypoxylon moriforme]